MQGLEGCSIPRLLSFIFVSLESTEKCYRIKRSTSPIETIIDKKLKEKQIDILKNNFKIYKLNMTLIIFNNI